MAGYYQLSAGAREAPSLGGVAVTGHRFGLLLSRDGTKAGRAPGRRAAALATAAAVVCGGMWLTVPAASAGSTKCGTACLNLFNQKFGTADVAAVSGGAATAGHRVILSATEDTTAEDWAESVQGKVSDLAAAGLINATLAVLYANDPVVEITYAPGGVYSGLCLAVASGPSQNKPVTLQPCGVSADSLWIDDAAAASGGYVPYISGSDTKYPAPYVLTAPRAGGDFTTQALSVNTNGTVASDQMWQLISGVLGTVPEVNRTAIWGGQVVGYNAHGQFTQIQASWQVPVLHCSAIDDVFNRFANVKVWTGFGGTSDPNAPDPALVQTGSESWCSLTGQQQDQAWWEVFLTLPIYPEVDLPTSSYPVQPGDHMFGEVFYTGGGTGNTYELYLADSTQNWHFDLVCPSAQCAYGTVPVTIPNGYPAHAEAIVERDSTAGSPLPDFGQILFTNVKYTYAGTAPAGGLPVQRVEPPASGTPEMTVSTTLVNWTVTWQHSF